MDSLGAKFQELVHLGQNLLQSSAVSIILTILALLSANLWYFYKPYWGVRRVPGPPALPLVGHLPLLAKYGPDVFSVLAKQYGPVFRFHMGRQPMIVVADAELCREAGIKKFKDLTNRSIPFPVAASPLHQKGLFFSNTDTSREKSWNINCVPFGWAASPETISLHKVLGEATHPDEKWSSMRNTILSVYQPSHLAKLIPTMQSYIESASANLETQGDIEFSELSLKLATDIIGKTAFGVDFCLSKLQADKDSHQQDDEEVQEFIKQHIYSTTQLKMDLSGSLSMTLGILMPILQEPFRRILERIPGTMDRKVNLINLNLANRLDEIVTKKMKEKDRGSKDFLSLILNAMESHTTARNAFTPDYISAVSYEHLLAGSATTSFTLSTIIYLVAGHPEVEKKLFREIDEFGPLDQIPTADDLQNKFNYLDQVIKEAMRFYTMSPLVARETSRLVEIGGYILPKGTWVWLAPGILAKDPKNFPEPDKFKPERFDPDCEEHKRRHPYAHIPFGIGPRSCIGQKFSIQEIKLSLIHFYRRYAFRHSSGMKVPLELEYGIIMSFKNGLKVRAIKRA